MITCFESKSADDVWRKAVSAILDAGTLQPGRGGDTKELLHVGLQITDPRQRWIYSRREALNVAFALAEVIWMLGGRDDSRMVNYFNRSLSKFAGGGSTYHGAYGQRLRCRYGFDQLKRAALALKSNPEGRQVVLTIWDPRTDFPTPDGQPQSPDIPCNLVSMLKVRNGRLDWTQIMRSNDAYRGLPHNLVQFTFLQEVIAGWAGIPPGLYTHWSDSLHLYDLDIRSDPRRTVAEELGVSGENFALPISTFENMWPTVESFADSVTDETLRAADLVASLERINVPSPWHNVLRILAAEGLRRRKADPQTALGTLTDPFLRSLWSRWYDRVGQQAPIAC